MAPRVIPVDPFDLVIFGGTGDLARRKILPGLFRRYRAGDWPIGEPGEAHFAAMPDPGLGLPHARIASGDSCRRRRCSR